MWRAMAGLATVVALGACGGGSGSKATTTHSPAPVTSPMTSREAQALFGGLAKDMSALPLAYTNDDQSDVAAQWSAEADRVRRVASEFDTARLRLFASDAQSVANLVSAVGECISGGETPTDSHAFRFVHEICAGTWGQSQDALKRLSDDIAAASGG